MQFLRSSSVLHWRTVRWQPFGVVQVLPHEIRRMYSAVTDRSREVALGSLPTFTLTRRNGVNGEYAAGVECDSRGRQRLLERAAVEQGGAAARHGGDNAAGIDHAEPTVQSIGNVEVALAIERHVGGVKQRGRGRLHAISREAASRVAGHGGDDALGGYFAAAIDRKSTRLNSSHLGISYAVFC